MAEASTEIAAIDDGGANTAAEVRAALERLAAFSGAQMSKTANQEISGTIEEVTWETADYDTDSYVDLPNNRFVIPWDGYYEVDAVFRWEATGENWRHIFVRLNGATISGEYTEQPERVIAGVTSGPFEASAGDFLTIEAESEDTADIESTITFVKIRWLGA